MRLVDADLLEGVEDGRQNFFDDEIGEDEDYVQLPPIDDRLDDEKNIEEEELDVDENDVSQEELVELLEDVEESPNEDEKSSSSEG